MNKKIKKIIFSLLITFMPVIFIAPQSYALPIISSDSTSTACTTLNNINPKQGCNSNGLVDVIQAIVNILSYIVGAVAVIMVIVAGLMFVTAGGDTNKVSSARSTLIYAIIGLVLVILAQVIIKVVIHTANKAS